MERPYENEARLFCTALYDFAAHPEAIENLESYLSVHFSEWLEEYASDPVGIASEMMEFSRIY